MRHLVALPDGRLTAVLGDPMPDDYAERIRADGNLLVSVEEGELQPHELVETCWIDPASCELRPRPEFPASIDKAEISANGEDTAVISGLPKPCTVLVDGQPVERKGGTLTLTSDMPADYEIICDQWPYLPWSVTVRAR